MAITDNQKVDYLYKKVGYALSKTDTNLNKLAPNESITSPLLLRGDIVWQQSGSIPAVKPTSNTTIVTVYNGATTVECTSDITATNYRTWKTGLTGWIPPQFGSSYLANVYIHTSGDAANAATLSNKVFITGSGNDDEWFFDYESGILNFNGTNLPNGVDFTGKSVYIEAARYTGTFGVGPAAGEDATIGDLEISGTTITTADPTANIIIDPETGYVSIAGTTAIKLPVGTTLERPSGVEGMLRYNSETNLVEVYDGSAWKNWATVETVSFDAFTGDDTTTAFTLSRAGTNGSTFVSINGVLQEIANTYAVNGTTLTFNEAPLSTDVIHVRSFFSAQDVEISGATITDTANTTKIQVEKTAADATIRFDAAGVEVAVMTSARVSVNVPVQFASYTTTQRNALTPTNGDVIYNSTDDKFQGYAGSTWVNLH